MNDTTNTAMDMEDELDFDMDSNLDGVEDLIEYLNPTDGSHILRVGDCSIQEVGKDAIQMVTFTYQLVGTESLLDDTIPPTPLGSLFTERFGAKHKKYLKARMKSLLGDALIGMNLRDQMQAVMDNFSESYYISVLTKTSLNDKGFENLRMRKVTPIDPIELPEGFQLWPLKD